jgi:hypothetical protein
MSNRELIYRLVGVQKKGGSLNEGEFWGADWRRAVPADVPVQSNQFSQSVAVRCALQRGSLEVNHRDAETQRGNESGKP